MELGLRYYASRIKPTDYTPLSEEHKKIIELLNKIREKHKIKIEVTDLSDGDESIPDQIIRARHAYEHDFMPKAKILKKRVGVRLSVGLKKRGFINLSETIAITCDGGIGWYATPRKEFKKYDENFKIGFLKMLLDNGPILLSELCPPLRVRIQEDEILEKFIKSGILKGKFTKNVQLGLARIKKEANSCFFDEFSRFRNSHDNLLLSKLRRVDAVCSFKNTVWILEVKKRLNETALGQALIYRELLSEDFPPEKFPELDIRVGIVCEILHPWIEDICKEYDVRVFVVRVNKN